MWIQLQLYERLKGYERDAAQRLVEFCTGLGAGLAAGAGGVHQGLAHRAFKHGGWCLLRNHKGQQSVILQPPLWVVEDSSSEKIAELASWWENSPANVRPAGMYALPSNPTFAAVDSAVILGLALTTAKAPTLALSTSGSSVSSAMSSITNTSTQLLATEPLEAGHTGADADTAGAAALEAEALQAGMDEAPASAAASPLPAATGATGSAGVKALVLGIQITTNRSHKINYPGWKSFSSATGSHILAFAVPLRSWSTYPLQKFQGGPANAAQQEPCDQQVMTWVPVTVAELDNLTVDGLRELGKAYGIDDSTLPRDVLVSRLLEVEVPTADWGVLEAALPKRFRPPQAQAAATVTEPAASAADLEASALYAAGVPVVNGEVQQTISLEKRFSKAQVRGSTAKWIRQMSECHGVPTKDENGKLLRVEDLQARFISQLGIDR